MSKHELLTSEAHRGLRVRRERGADFGDAIMSCVTFPSEFRQVQNEYPILFRLSPERESFTALAMFGLETGENLFLRGTQWHARYLPLAIDIQPFLIGGSPHDSGDKQVHVDLESARLTNDEGVRLFDQAGLPTPFLETMSEKLGALDEGYRGAPDFFSALRRYDLLEPMTLEVTLDDGSTNRLVGFHVIAEERLRTLSDAEVAELHRAGHLMPIFMAVASLSNLNTLIAWKNERMGRG